MRGFDEGESPFNIDPSNLVWLDFTATSWITGKGPQIAFLWGNPQDEQPNGTLVELPAGFSGNITSTDTPIRAVVIAGYPSHRLADNEPSKALGPGDYFGSEYETIHYLISANNAESIIYLRSSGEFEFTNAADDE